MQKKNWWLHANCGIFLSCYVSGSMDWFGDVKERLCLINDVAEWNGLWRWCLFWSCGSNVEFLCLIPMLFSQTVPMGQQSKWCAQGFLSFFWFFSFFPPSLVQCFSNPDVTHFWCISVCCVGQNGTVWGPVWEFFLLRNFQWRWGLLCSHGCNTGVILFDFSWKLACYSLISALVRASSQSILWMLFSF